jgi:hypothetical protein
MASPRSPRRRHGVQNSPRTPRNCFRAGGWRLCARSFGFTIARSARIKPFQCRAASPPRLQLDSSRRRLSSTSSPPLVAPPPPPAGAPGRRLLQPSGKRQSGPDLSSAASSSQAEILCSSRSQAEILCSSRSGSFFCCLLLLPQFLCCLLLNFPSSSALLLAALPNLLFLCSIAL